MKTWAVYIAAALGFAIYGAATSVDRDDSGSIVGGGAVDAFSVRVGDCFNDTDTFSDEVSSVPGVPCTDPHDNETFAVFDVAFDSYPDEEVMAQHAYDSCQQQFEPFVGKDYESSTLEISTMYPTQQSWEQSDREVVCAIYDMNANKLVGSAKGRGL